MRSAAPALILALATVTALTGCVDQSTPPGPTSTAPTGLPSTAPTAPVDDGEVTPAPEAADDSQAAAIGVATAALDAFAQPELDYDTWWAGLLPHLTQQAGIAYEGTDPSQIPAHQVTGAGRVLEGSTEVSLIVQLPTDAGTYNVTLSRPSTTDPWLADRIRPTQG